MTGDKSNIASGRQLRAARVLVGLTQEKLSTEAGFGARAARSWERRRDNPPTSVDGTLEAIEAALLRHGVDILQSNARLSVGVEQIGRTPTLWLPVRFFDAMRK